MYRHAHACAQTRTPTNTHTQCVWKMMLFYVNSLLSLALSFRRLHITRGTTSLCLSLTVSLSQFLAHVLPLLFHLSLFIFPLLCHAPACLPISSDTSSSPLFLHHICRLSPPHRRGEWISKLIPDSCSGW